MILIDFTQTIIAGLMVQLKMNNGEVSEDMLRHMILNSVRGYQRKYAAEYGEITLCTDASHPWRRDYFPQYKANRKKSREADNKDWGLIFDTLHKVKMEIKENFPYRYMYVEKCEADDIIGTLVEQTQEFGQMEDVMIISADKDFIQLQKYGNVKLTSAQLKSILRGISATQKKIYKKGMADDGKFALTVVALVDRLANIIEKQHTAKQIAEQNDLLRKVRAKQKALKNQLAKLPKTSRSPLISYFDEVNELTSVEAGHLSMSSLKASGRKLLNQVRYSSR